ncbi:carbohydrate kinase [Leptolyngbya sp. FACHB-711]|uniref:carbohydrate kinase family protein n=1 Tax=unclassified Leptolyngbya TaxID=2650499 RepID=UPI001687ED57|nr:carbohydrate kinase [Leptolyngbya sp. FACHB-711]MBD1849536.1 carbohydrate kinase [Cyanobacteria bacterium FACHB-502]MBD2024893.1 carbohydrate kinase [Leptolyngbya sp. FACHB-711]
MTNAPQVLCLGEMLWDCIADHPADSVNAVKSWTSYAGGAPANVACGLVKLGTPAALIACIGEDVPGEQLVEILEQIGVDLRGIQRHATAPTRQIDVLRSNTGDRTFAGFRGGETTDFADTRLKAELLPIDLFEGAQFLVCGTIGFAYPESRAAFERAIALAKAQSVHMVLDVNWRPVFWQDHAAAKLLILDVMRQADLLKLSIEEAEWLLNTDRAAIVAERFPHLKGVLITAGEAGCEYWFSGNVEQVPAFSVEVEETTGAGDGFVAGLVHQLCVQGMEALADPDRAHQIVRYASAVGSLTTIRAGAIEAQPQAEEVEAFLYLMRNGLS